MSKKLLQPELTTATGVLPSSVKSAILKISVTLRGLFLISYLIYPLTLLLLGGRPLL